MKDFPKWMLALAGINLLPVLLSPLYLFGGLPLCQGTSGLSYLLFYVLTQLAWVAPLALFFASLDFYRRGFEAVGIALALAGCLISAGGAWMVLA